ncbi:MAG: tryptophan synthase subunit alpha [Gammaproteobacteria bacterium]|nr:tryptophan synthase subunit alpha [Gammaproteobacteria bacterium]MCY4217963.1 tryptophan synthase subunit alpha [Gammaproteobacteria bacterium]
MTQRLQTRFEELKQEKRAGLVTFITAGDPNPEISLEILNGLPEAGADIIELGMPFSDPMADGPAIQLSSQRALKNGASLINTLEMVDSFRKTDDQTPIILMGYFNPIYRYGSQKFLNDAMSIGVDGLIIVDLPPEEDDELCHACLTTGLNWIRLTTPTSDSNRLPRILKNSSGFVYHVAITGITGTRSAKIEELEAAVKRIRTQTSLPIAVGFGIKSPTQIKDIGHFADAVVVGSALVNTVKSALEENLTKQEIVKKIHEFVTELASGLR